MPHVPEPLTAPYRPVRPVSAPDDAPWPGMLVCLDSGDRRVLVDATVLGTGWRGWDASADGHVLAPLDIARRTDGHDVVLPVCPERADAFLARRRANGYPLRSGEAVTLGVSVLRGAADLLARPDTTGEWWLTDDGRPVFATDASPRPAAEACAALLRELGAIAPHRAWDEAVASLDGARLSAVALERAEAALFGVAGPEPLGTDAAAPRPGRVQAPARAAESPPAVDAETRGLWHGLARHVDADLADLVSRATTAIWRRSREPRAARRAPWIVAGAAAAGVLGIGLMWPSGGDDAATADAPTPTATSSATAGADAATPTRASPPPVSGELTDVVAALLEARVACGGEEACLAQVMLDPSTPWTAGVVDAAADARSVVLLDDFGGVAVLRVDAVDGAMASQLVVVVRLEDEWLLRDVQDVAQQP